MDDRRLSTADLLYGGILNAPTPETSIPEDRETVDASGESGCTYVGDDAVAALLDAGKVVKASLYYGIPNVWKVGDGAYRGTLLQYRAVTEDETFNTAASAAKWFGEMYRRCDG